MMQESVIFSCTLLPLQSSSGLSLLLSFESFFTLLKKYVKIIWRQDQSNFHNQTLQLFKEIFWVCATSASLKITHSPKSLFLGFPPDTESRQGLKPASHHVILFSLSSLLVFGSSSSSSPILTPIIFLGKDVPALFPQFMKPEQSTKIGMVEYAKCFGVNWGSNLGRSNLGYQ